MPTPLITGIHQVTAIAGPAARSLRFYTHVLGMRLVKRTVNFDAPFAWRLSYGDEVGSAGTLVTHFPHARAKPGSHGTTEISAAAERRRGRRAPAARSRPAPE